MYRRTQEIYNYLLHFAKAVSTGRSSGLLLLLSSLCVDYVKNVGCRTGRTGIFAINKIICDPALALNWSDTNFSSNCLNIEEQAQMGLEAKIAPSILAGIDISLHT